MSHPLPQAIQAGAQVVAGMCAQLEAWAARVLGGRPKRLNDLVLLPQVAGAG
jgi:hypothetical protein